MKIITPEIRQGFHRMGSRYGKLFDSERFLSRDPWDGNRLTPDPAPYTNIKLTANVQQFEIAVPGFKKKDLLITIENNILIVRGQKDLRKENSSKYIRKEYEMSSFKKVFELIPEIDTANIQAHYHDGILELKLNYRQEVARKKSIQKITVD
jgi:HSP20 family molecular chaperone IbpA